MDKILAYRQLIKQNIEYDILCQKLNGNIGILTVSYTHLVPKPIASINKNIKCLISVFFFNVTICKTKNLHTLTYIQYMKAQ